MGGFLRHLFVFVALQAVLLTAFMWGFYSVAAAYPMYSLTRLKHARLEEAPSPKLVLVGGSNLLYGIESELIEERTSYHPVNMGLIGLLGLEFMIDEVVEDLDPGDLVVVSAEYTLMQRGPRTFENRAMMRVLSERPASARYLHWYHWKQLSEDGVFEHFGEIFRRGWSAMRKGKRKLAKRGFNVYGDRIDLRDATRRMGGDTQPTLPRQLRLAKFQEAFDLLNRFHAECKARGITVVYSCPPVPSSHWRGNEEKGHLIHQALRESITIPMIDEPADMVFPVSDFVSASYHLQGPAIGVRTNRLIDGLLRYQAESQASSTAGDGKEGGSP